MSDESMTINNLTADIVSDYLREHPDFFEQGTPEDVAKHSISYTAKYLKEALN